MTDRSSLLGALCSPIAHVSHVCILVSFTNVFTIAAF